MDCNHKCSCINESARSIHEQHVVYEGCYADYDSQCQIQTAEIPIWNDKQRLPQNIILNEVKSPKSSFKSIGCSFRKHRKYFEASHSQKTKEIRFRGLTNEKSSFRERNNRSSSRYAYHY